MVGQDGFARVKLAPHAAPEPLYEPLINSKMVAELPLAGLSFPSLRSLPFLAESASAAMPDVLVRTAAAG